MNIEHIQQSISKANNFESKLSSEVLGIKGMSGSKNRHLLNNLLSFGNLSYLEVGCWRGSTACSSMYKNELSQCVLIDNFSEFGEDFFKIDSEWDNGIPVRDDLKLNLEKFGCKNYIFKDADLFSVNLSLYKKFDVFFYDGCHDFEPQKESLEYVFDNLNNRFLFISDDYCFPVVKKAVDESIAEIINKSIPIIEIKLEREEPINDNWWHGLYIGLFDKI